MLHPLVVRVFGIYTHTQLNRRVWDAMGQQLAQRGAEYQLRSVLSEVYSRGEDSCTTVVRCVHRNKPAKVGKHAGTILPGSWPALAEDEPVPSTMSLLPDLHEDDLEKVKIMISPNVLHH